MPNPGKKTMNSVAFARLLGVSQSTVSRALNNSPRVPEDVRKRIRQKATEVGFELNSQAQSLKTRRTGTIGVLFPHHFRSMSENLMLANIFDHIQRNLIASDYDVMMVYDYGPGSKASVLKRMIKRGKLDGLILFRPELSDEESNLVLSNHFPCVYMLNKNNPDKGISCFVSDVEEVGYQAGSFFGRFPGYRPLFLTTDEEEALTEQHYAGLKRGFAEHGMAFSRSNMKKCGLSIESAYDFVMRNRKMFQTEKIAITTRTDVFAVAILAALRDLGVTVPEQVQIIGADDVFLANWIRPALSATHVPVEEMVNAGCRHLRNLIERVNSDFFVAVFKPTLVLRGTTLPPPDGL